MRVSSTRRSCARALVVMAATLVSCGRAAFDPPHRDPGFPRAAPLVGVDMIYQDRPHVLIRAFGDPARGDELAEVLRDRLGLTAIRLDSFGFYSFLGPARSAELRRQTQQNNSFPWFPIDDVARFVAEHDLPIVAGVNLEDGPDSAVTFVDRFRAAGALDRIVAVEIGNEPHLSKRPWYPEEYAKAAAAIVRAVTPLGVRCAVSFTVGSETKTPTGISDDEYTRRELAALDAELGLAGRDDLFGVVHLYAGGVDPAVIDRLDGLVRPVAPRMRYLVTEFNIRSSLRDNAQLTIAYGLEALEKTSRLVAHPSVAGLFMHGVPYHSVVYWSGEAGVLTVSGFRDDRLTGEARSPGWHLTPAGQLYGLYAREVWRGDLLDFVDEGEIQTWRVRRPDGEPRTAVLNASASAIDRTLDVGGTSIRATLPPRSAVVFGPSGELARVVLPPSP